MFRFRKLEGRVFAKALQQFRRISTRGNAKVVVGVRNSVAVNAVKQKIM
jgi:hypothetical protein